MSKKKKKSVPVPQPKQEKKMVIDMTKVELAKAYEVPSFRTGKHMTEKDRPRKKNWKKEYERKGSGKYGEYGTYSFLMGFLIGNEWYTMIVNATSKEQNKREIIKKMFTQECLLKMLPILLI